MPAPLHIVTGTNTFCPSVDITPGTTRGWNNTIVYVNNHGGTGSTTPLDSHKYVAVSMEANYPYMVFNTINTHTHVNPLDKALVTSQVTQIVNPK